MISEQHKLKVLEATDLIDLIGERVPLRKSGASYVGPCPWCTKKKLSIKIKTDTFKCFACDKSGGAIQWVMEWESKTYPEAVTYLAEKYNVSLGKSYSKKNSLTTSFRDAQLIASGIDNKSQISLIKDGDKEIEIDRYTSGTEVNWELQPGDDMILNYVSLDRKLVTYIGKFNRSTKPKTFYRVRYANPERDLKLDSKGKAAKYKSPAGGGNHLWLPEYIIRSFDLGVQIDTLIVVEGEKKADKLCIEHYPAVGIAGIHNFSTDSGMPNDFNRLIKKCGIKKVVFMLDSDCKDIHIDTKGKSNASIDSRPMTFASAVVKFWQYFDGYRTEGHIIRPYLAYHLDTQHKGVDDFLVYNKTTDTKDVMADLSKSIQDVKHSSALWKVHHLINDEFHKVKEYFHVENIPSFIEHFKDQILKTGLTQVKIKGRYFDIAEGEIIETNQIRESEQFWKDASWTTKEGKLVHKIKYDVYQVNDFLRSQGFGWMEVSKQRKFVKVESNIIREVMPDDIRYFVTEYTRDMQMDWPMKKEILTMLFASPETYFSAVKLGNMYKVSESMYEPSPHEQILIFKNNWWKITATEITVHDLNTLPSRFWDGKQIMHEPQLIPDAVNIKMEEGKFKVAVSDDIRGSDMWRYMWGTSNFHWRDEYREVKDKETGIVSYEFKGAQQDPDKIQSIWDNLVPKMLAMGYLSTDYISYSNLKAIICMDNAESAVGSSKGGSGKSIFGAQFVQWKPVYRIDGKKKDLESDSFLYDGLDSRIELIYFDDCRVNLDFDFFFSQITGGITVNSKGLRKVNLPPIKMLFNTNHSLSGNNDSSRRRQYIITFSDYYNINRTPFTEFGKNMFYEWEFNDWNAYFNILAKSIQVNLAMGIQNWTIPGEDVIKRAQRQLIGEDFLDWADGYFDVLETNEAEKKFNKKVDLMQSMNSFTLEFPRQRQYVNKKIFRDKLRSWCAYMGYIFNPEPHVNKDGRIRSNGLESIWIQLPDYNDPIASPF